jgi:hypothetical protein
MAKASVRQTLKQFRQLVEDALTKDQDVHCTFRLGSYAEPGTDGYVHPRLDGSAVLLVVIDPLPPAKHPANTLVRKALDGRSEVYNRLQPKTGQRETA